MSHPPLDVPFQLANPWDFPQFGQPLRCSLPLPRGSVREPAAELCLLDEEGRDLAAQWRVLSTWNDGSARFALMDYAESRLEPRETRRYRVVRRAALQSSPSGRGQGEGSGATLPNSQPGTSHQPAERENLARNPQPATSRQSPHPGSLQSGEGEARAGIRVEETPDRLTVDTGRLRWVFSKARWTLAEEVRFNGREWIGGRPADLCVFDTRGQVYRASRGDYRISVEEPGPYRVVVLLEGDFANPAERFMSHKTRLHFTAGGSQVLMSHTIRNRHGGREGRGVRRWSLTGALALGDNTVRRIQHIARGLNTVVAVVEVPENVDLDTGAYQTVIRNGASLREDRDDPAQVCYSVARGLDMGRYGACSAMIDLHEPGTGGMLFGFAMPEPEREGPMRLASEGNRFEIDFYPDSPVPAPPDPESTCETEHPGPMHLGEGMGKTRDVLLHFHDDSLSPRDTLYQSGTLSYPGVVAAPAAMYRAAEFAEVHHTLPQRLNKYPMLESKIDLLLSAPQAYDGPRASGWRDWGDEVGARGRCPEFGVVQYINNEEDYLYCLMIDAWRTAPGSFPGGKARTVARHLMDIDFIDYSDDPARDGATCPHSTGHTNGEVYPSHQWCQGLLYYYLATGDEEALRISRRIGDNLIWWVTGPRSDSLHYSGRESAWPLLALASLYEVTHEEKYRDAGMRIIEELESSYAKHGHLAWEYPPGSGIYSGYMALMVFNGIWDMYQATGDERVLDLWKKASGPVVERLADPGSWGYLHFRNWPIKWADLTTLMRWYQLTGDRRYVDLGRNGLRLILAGCPQPLNQTQGFIAMGYRHFIFFLKLADEFGMIDDDHCTLVW